MTGKRFEMLEKRCKALEKKHLIRVYISSLFLLVTVLGVFWFVYTPKEVYVETSPLPSSAEVVVAEKVELNETQDIASVVVTQTPIEPIDTNVPTLFLAPKFKSKEENVTLTQQDLEAERLLFLKENSLVEAYKYAPTYENAYVLAQFCFEQKLYDEAIDWAKRANKLNPNAEQTWIIYAKSKFHLGDREEAISSLERILGYIKSEEINELLNFYKGQR
ncbi:tetratricopeptide repeat protein [Sulfurospirillum barnesii]|uniref:ChAPs (Chs5p-Arf1p-binding proteins) n=1 Tax=Sulfurospirillum barnesii (strain ATCC 700032 / DSM 10660 / SES-3) TaxID=760154 RepID=I3XXU1_SULBS|nr:CDC27 family protein [Sulfurospirillum barnesii]AFL68765.1 ChAPs (Chs5p-Arf1p-binding proteins) [Sulfurospirillum barnesii SES-3]